VFEWNRVTPIEFINKNNVSTKVRLRYLPSTTNRKTEVATEGNDIDTIALKYLGSELETFRLMNNNLTELCEYNFDLEKLGKVYIP
jgi:hypothetical protein